MHKIEVRKCAKLFTKKVDTLSFISICESINREGWRVVRFDDPFMAQFSKSMGLADYPKDKDSFTYYADDGIKKIQLICIRKDLTENCATLLLLHEIGHIELGHKFGSLSPQDEKDATLFAQIVRSSLLRKLYPQRSFTTIAAFAAVCIIVGGIAARYITAIPQPAQQASAGTSTSLTVSLPSVQLPDLPKASSSEAEDTRSEDPISGAVVVTKTGDRYHLPNCQYVQGKDNLRPMSIAEAQAAGYIPCKVCRPDDLG